MTRSIRARRARIALVLVIWSQACVVHRPAPADASLRPGTDMRIRSVVPLELTRQTDTLSAVTVCCLTTVEGRFLRVAGDTIVLERGSGVAINSGLTRIPGQHEILTVVRNSGTEVTMRQTDRARTTALLLGIAAAIVGLLAYAASQIEFDYPNNGGTSF